MKQSGIDSEKIIRRKSDGELEYQPDDLTIEEPLEIRVGGKVVATTMRTPGHDEELAIGFLISEAIVRDRGEVSNILVPNRPHLPPMAAAAIYGAASNPLPLSRRERRTRSASEGKGVGKGGADAQRQVRENVIDVDLAPGMKLKLNSAQRFGTISSSCGLCGKASIDAIRQNFPPIETRDVRIDVETLLALPAKLRDQQSDFARTGGIHAAGIFDVDGKLVAAREDIGRHNAVDKAIGRAFLDGLLPLDRHLLLVSGRASFEIVQKALAAGIPIVAAVSAPSSLAVSFAREANQTLIGFLRPPSFNIYSHIERAILKQD